MNRSYSSATLDLRPTCSGSKAQYRWFAFAEQPFERRMARALQCTEPNSADAAATFAEARAPDVLHGFSTRTPSGIPGRENREVVSGHR